MKYLKKYSLLESIEHVEWSFYSYNDLVNEFIEPREDSKIYSISVIIKEKL